MHLLGINCLQHRVQSDDGAQIWGRFQLSPQCSVPRQLGQLISQRRTLLRTILNCASSGGLARTCSTTMPITCFNYPISMPIGMSVLANTDWRRRKNHSGWGSTLGPPAPCSRAPEGAAARPKLQQPQVPAPLSCHHYRQYARRSSECPPPMHPSGHLRPDSSLVATQDPRQVSFSISRVSPRLASPGSDSSLSLFFLFFSRSVRDSFFLRTGHLRSSDNACFSFPSPDHRPSLYQISVRSRSTSDGPLRSSPPTQILLFASFD